MRFDVAEALRGPVGSVTRFQITRRGRGDPEGHVSFLRTPDGLLADVNAESWGRDTCSRCLRDIEYPLSIHFREEFFPSRDIYTGSPLPLPDETEDFLIEADFTLDLHEALRQYRLLLEAPAPLCSPTCKGLCALCGRDLNVDNCECREEPEGRWGTLVGAFPVEKAPRSEES